LSKCEIDIEATGGAELNLGLSFLIFSDVLFSYFLFMLLPHETFFHVALQNIQAYKHETYFTYSMYQTFQGLRSQVLVTWRLRCI